MAWLECDLRRLLVECLETLERSKTYDYEFEDTSELEERIREEVGPDVCEEEPERA